MIDIPVVVPRHSDTGWRIRTGGTHSEFNPHTKFPDIKWLSEISEISKGIEGSIICVIYSPVINPKKCIYVNGV